MSDYDAAQAHLFNAGSGIDDAFECQTCGLPLNSAGTCDDCDREDADEADPADAE